MSFLRWLFGRTKLNRADLAVILALVFSLPWWASLPAVLVWTIASLTIERLVFGKDYPERVDTYQALAEDWEK